MKYTIKKYENYEQEDILSLILSEIIKYKVSGGWCGDLETLNALKIELAKFNVSYVDDMFGEWRLSE